MFQIAVTVQFYCRFTGQTMENSWLSQLMTAISFSNTILKLFRRLLNVVKLYRKKALRRLLIWWQMSKRLLKLASGLETASFIPIL